MGEKSFNHHALLYFFFFENICFHAYTDINMEKYDLEGLHGEFI